MLRHLPVSLAVLIALALTGCRSPGIVGVVCDGGECNDACPRDADCEMDEQTSEPECDSPAGCIPCTTATECTPSAAFCVDGGCRQCRSDRDCAAGFECDDGFCEVRD